ncbi:response regulator transcription factor [Paenibacillus sp. OSY-SE]|uniref:response regulator transcription factor n=1 Tax=Paenibacillus sp. OSY-SE TaxID=1196323 RepID=UPI0002D52F8D|nr:response regulator transcription factor [Paenibacillus sp. OSY-SE]
MISVLIADDDAFIRESLKLIVGMHPDIDVVGTCGNGKEAERAVAELGADVVLMDMRMPECDGVEGTRRIKERHPDVKVLILTTFDDDEYIVEAMRCGASGYLLKNNAPERIVEGIRTVHAGSVLMDPDVARKLAQLLQAPSRAKKPESMWSAYALTATEQTITERVADGMSNKEIAAALHLSEGTVKNYISDILSKLSLRDRTQLAIFYWKQQ